MRLCDATLTIQLTGALWSHESGNFFNETGQTVLQNAVTHEVVENCIISSVESTNNGMRVRMYVDLNLAIPGPMQMPVGVDHFRGERHEVRFPRTIQYNNGSVEIRGENSSIEIRRGDVTLRTGVAGTDGNSLDSIPFPITHREAGEIAAQGPARIGTLIGNVAAIARVNFDGEAAVAPNRDIVAQRETAFAATQRRMEDLRLEILAQALPSTAADIVDSVVWRRIEGRARAILAELVPAGVRGPTRAQADFTYSDMTMSLLTPLPPNIPTRTPPLMDLLDWSGALIGMWEVRGRASQNYRVISQGGTVLFTQGLDLLNQYCPAVYCLVVAELEEHTKMDFRKFIKFISTVIPQEPLSQAPTFQFNEDVIDDSPDCQSIGSGQDLVADSVEVDFRKIISCQDKPNAASSPPPDGKRHSSSMQYSSPATS